MRAELDNSELSDRTWTAALEGNARASTGSVNYLERHDKVTGEVMCWPIAELSVFDGGDERVPVSDDAIVLPLRALFDEHSIKLPENFEAGEDKGDEVDKPTYRKKDVDVTEDIKKIKEDAVAEYKAAEALKVEEKAAMRAEIEEELKEDPKYRATFNIQKETAGAGRLTPEEKEAGWTSADKEEEHEYIWGLMHPQQSGMAVTPEKRALILETAAGLPIVPDKTLHKIHERRDLSSFARQAGVPIYQTDSLVLDIPAETVSMVTLPVIAENAVYTDLEPTIGTVTATVVKHGGYVEGTEEFLQDQDLFVPYLTRSIGRALGLAENVDMAALMILDAAGTSVNNAGAGAFTKTEALAWYYALDAEYRDQGAFFMADDFLGFLRAAETANSPTFTGLTSRLGLQSVQTTSMPALLMCPTLMLSLKEKVSRF